MAADVEIAELSLDRAGLRLKRAREAAGKSLADVSAATKIPERLLVAIEASQFSLLPSRIYAIGFSRSYARLVGLDETAIVNEVRAEIDGAAPRSVVTSTQAFAPGDPARVPQLRLAIAAGLGAVLVIVAGLVFWHSAYNPAGSLPSILPADAPSGPIQSAAKSDTPVVAAIHAPVPAPPTGGAVSLSAMSANLWVKIYEASGKILFQKQMALGETFTLPADAQAPLIWTARPDALAITVGGRPVPKLSERQRIIKGVPISAAALLARTAPATAASRPMAATADSFAQ